MIRFFGTIKNQIQADVTNKRTRQVGIMMFTGAVVLLILSVIVYLIFREERGEFYKCLILISLCIIVALLIFLPVKRNKLRFEWIYNITITNELITVDVLHQNNVVLNHPIKEITKVEDYGEYYYLFVHRWEAIHGIVCQKDLLIEGTLEEFEKLFAGKIIRKIK